MKISDYYTYAPKSKIKAGDANPNGKYQFYTSSPDESRRCDEYLYDCKAIVMGTGGSATLHYYDGKFSTSTDCLTLIPNEKIRAKYLYYFFLANMDVLEAGFKGAGLKHTSKGYIDNIEITKIPSLPSQDKIVNLFDELALRIEKERRQIEKLDELVKARFVEMFKGKYDSFKVDEKLKTTSGGTPKSSVSEYYDGGDIPWLTSGEVNYGDITKSSNYITEKGLNNSSAKWVPENSIVIAMYGATAGKVGIVRYKTTTNQAVCSVLPNDNFNQEFLRYAFQDISEELTSKAIGGGQPNISQTIIKNSYIVDAPIEEQERFASFAKQVDKSKFMLSNELTMCDFYIRLIHDRVMHSCVNLRVAQ